MCICYVREHRFLANKLKFNKCPRSESPPAPKFKTRLAYRNTHTHAVKNQRYNLARHFYHSPAAAFICKPLLLLPPVIPRHRSGEIKGKALSRVYNATSSLSPLSLSPSLSLSLSFSFRVAKRLWAGVRKVSFNPTTAGLPP